MAGKKKSEKKKKKKLMEKTFPCPICSKVLARQWNLNQHMKIHKDERKKCKCPSKGCRKKFFDIRNMHQHALESHPEESLSFESLKWEIVKKKYDVNLPTCTQCKQSFLKSYNLQEHMASYHNKKRPKFKCQCNATFTTKPSLLRHMKNRCKRNKNGAKVDEHAEGNDKKGVNKDNGVQRKKSKDISGSPISMTLQKRQNGEATPIQSVNKRSSSTKSFTAGTAVEVASASTVPDGNDLSEKSSGIEYDNNHDLSKNRQIFSKADKISGSSIIKRYNYIVDHRHRPERIDTMQETNAPKKSGGVAEKSSLSSGKNSKVLKLDEHDKLIDSGGGHSKRKLPSLNQRSSNAESYAMTTNVGAAGMTCGSLALAIPHRNPLSEKSSDNDDNQGLLKNRRIFQKADKISSSNDINYPANQLSELVGTVHEKSQTNPPKQSGDGTEKSSSSDENSKKPKSDQISTSKDVINTLEQKSKLNKQKSKLNDSENERLNQKLHLVNQRGHAKKIIQCNKFAKVVEKKVEIEMPRCMCPPGSGCAENCINRNTFYECDLHDCISNCTNNRIQKREMPNLDSFWTTNKGFGVKALQKIKSGSFIIEYVGEVLTEEQLKTRMNTQYRNDKHDYSMSLGNGFVIDARNMGNLSRCVNHSCQPNAEIQKWIVNGLPSLVLFAIKDIMPEEEITFDYKFRPYNEHSRSICHCNEPNCRKFLGLDKSPSNTDLNNSDREPELNDYDDHSKNKLLHRTNGFIDTETVDHYQYEEISQSATDSHIVVGNILTTETKKPQKTKIPVDHGPDDSKKKISKKERQTKKSTMKSKKVKLIPTEKQSTLLYFKMFNTQKIIKQRFPKKKSMEAAPKTVNEGYEMHNAMHQKHDENKPEEN